MTSDRPASASDRLALFTCADVVGQSQFNAWGSWQRIPGCSVSVFGQAHGIEDHAQRFGFRSMPGGQRDEFGRPLLNAIVERMHQVSVEPTLGYINSDIILLPGLAASLAAVRAEFAEYLIIARRWNVESLPALDFVPGWDQRLRHLVSDEGELFTPYGIDLFVFSRGLLHDLPPFALGSDYWDNYLVMRARRSGYPVIDVTPQVMLVHQNHPLGRYRSAAERRRGPEGLRALALTGDSPAMLGQTGDATHVVVQGELKRADTVHVTMVVPHRGETRRLCHCLRSLEFQTYPRSYLNTIVVNNDPDAPLRYLEAEFPTVRVVIESTPGTAAARNKGISCATTDVVGLFDSDVYPTATCLERALRVMREQPDCQIVVCRVDPLMSPRPASYLGRTVEWFDALTHYPQRDWKTDAGTFLSSALIVRRNVFAQCGYFTELRAEAPSADQQWAKRVLAAGVKVAFCRHATVRRAALRDIVELKRAQQRAARGDCIVKLLDGRDTYGVADIIRDQWREFRARVRKLWASGKIPARYRAGAIMVGCCALGWTISAKLQYRKTAQHVIRRRRHAIDRAVVVGSNDRAKRAPSPFRWLSGRVADRRAAVTKSGR